MDWLGALLLALMCSAFYYLGFLKGKLAERKRLVKEEKGEAL